MEHTPHLQAAHPIDDYAAIKKDVHSSTRRRDSRFSRLRICFVLVSLVGSRAFAQTAACSAADLYLTFQVHEEADVERITLLTRNISGHDCLLTASYPANFVVQGNAPQIELCQRCANRLPGGEDFEKLPLVLADGAFAHQTFRYRTSSRSDTPGCVQPGWMSATANADMQHPLIVTSKSLLKPICSAVDVVGYRAGPGDVTPLDTATPDGERQPMLKAERSTYYAGEEISLRTDPQPVSAGVAPVLLLYRRSPGGDTRIEEALTRKFRMDTFFHEVGSADGSLEIYSGGRISGADFGEHQFQLLQFDGTTGTGEVHSLHSRPITVLVADAAKIERTWGETQQGVRVDLTLDKTEFHLGEDIAAHIATQVADGTEPVYGEPYVRRGAFLSTGAASFHLSIWDADGPLENSDRLANLFAFPDGSSGPLVCPSPLEVNKVLPVDRSLRDFGLLPTRPGTYQISVTWSPYHALFSDCLMERPPAPERSFVTVTSRPVTITVVGDTRPTALPQFPEYTAWKAQFRLVDTGFGPLTALLDSATGFEWLRPTLLADPNRTFSEQNLTDRMAPGMDLTGWRFATRDEVRNFLAHFTGSPDGRSQDPAVERKLLRLLGGTLLDKPDRQTGWIDSRITVRIAGLTPAPADHSPDGSPLTCGNCGPGFWAHAAFIREGVKDGHVSVTIDPDQPWKITGPVQDSAGVGYFLVGSR